MSRRMRSELDRWPLPRFVSRAGASQRLIGAAPALARVAPGAASPEIQQTLALRIEVEKSQHASTLRRVHGLVTADEFVVPHAAVSQHDSTPRLDPDPGSKRQLRPEHHCIEKIAL